MNKIKRLMTIHRVLTRYGLDTLSWRHPLLSPFQWTKIFLPWTWFTKTEQPHPDNIRQALIELGPIFVKFGQLLSTRRDILSAPLADALAQLQDSVPPFDSQEAKTMIEARFGKPIDDIFDEFEYTPIGSASIAQVHKARLKSGEVVVIKLLRPNIEKLIKQDVALLKQLAGIAQKSLKGFEQFKPVELVEEFESTLAYELDLLREAANASQLRRHFRTSHQLYVPKVYWPYCHKDCLVMEYIEGIPIGDIDALIKAKVNLKKLATYGVEIFFTQVFRDCFFHADMHPGNIFVDVKDPENPKYLAVDFGIMGSLNPEDQKYLAANFMAFFERDYRRVALLHIESGWIPPMQRVDAFESSIRAVCEPIFEKPLSDISFGKTLLGLFQTAKQFDMQVQPQLMLLQKTLLCVEGLGKQLYPELNLWDTAKPFLEQWMKEHMGLRSFRANLKQKLPLILNKMPNLPEALLDIVEYHQKQIHKEKSVHTKKKTDTGSAVALSLIGVSMGFLGYHLWDKLEHSLLLGIGFGLTGALLWARKITA